MFYFLSVSAAKAMLLQPATQNRGTRKKRQPGRLERRADFVKMTAKLKDKQDTSPGSFQKTQTPPARIRQNML